MAFAASPANAAAPAGLQAYVGSMHEHSAYSDGWPGTRPHDYYESGATYGNDFMGSSDHSDNLGLPIVLSEACYGQGRGGDGEVLAAQCALADQVNPADSFRKWDATAEQAKQVMDEHPGFSAFRGFEWSSNRYGHISVYFGSNWTSAYSDGGFVDMDTFWGWFTRPATLGGGSDAIATFNHPGAKKIDIPGLDPSQTGFNWNDFAYVPAADERMVGIEVFNDKDEYGSQGGPYPEGSYAHALDKGWHVGAVGAEDLGHRKPPIDNWGGPEWAKTVVLAPANTPAALRAALLDRHFYAIGPGENKLRLSFTVDGQTMGAQLQRAAGAPLRIAASVSDPGVKLELVTSGGKVVGTGGDSLKARRAATAKEGWYYVRAKRDGKPVAYSSPVWIEATDGGLSGQWYAGDDHVHTCFSHDAYCPPNDDNTGPDTFYSSFGTVAERFAEAAVKGLDFLIISDHNDIRAQADPDFGSMGVVGMPAYEASLSGGHAQMMGARKLYDKGNGGAEATRALAASLRADGGSFQANHPGDNDAGAFDSCPQADNADWAKVPLNWKYGFSVLPNTIEVWNATTLMAPSELYWECWLQSGARIGATAGSDSHGATTPTVGMPTTWVFARSSRPRDLIAAIAAGRTTLSRLPPALGGARLLLEGDKDGDGKYESMVGDQVPPGTPLRVRAEGLTGAGLVRVRANGKTVENNQTLLPGGELKLKAPAEGGWVRATLYLADGTQAVDPGCLPIGQPLDSCSRDLAIAAMTSPIWVGKAAPLPAETPGDDTPPRTGSAPADEPDSGPPLPAPEQAPASAALPDVPKKPLRGGALSKLSAKRTRPCGRGGTAPLRVSWIAADKPVEVQLWKDHAWKTLTSAARGKSYVLRARCGAVYRFRLRTRPAGRTPGPYRRVTVRVGLR